MKKITVLLISLTLILYIGVNTYSEVSPATKTSAKSAIDKSLVWLKNQQKPNGSFEDHPGITALVATAFITSPNNYNENNNETVKKAIQYLLTMVKPDGGIYKEDLPNYNTSIAIMALTATKNPAYKDIIKNAQRTIVSYQFDEGDGLTPSDKYYGGIGYGSTPVPDMSNLKYSLEALKASELPKDSEVWSKAVKFLERCQNRSESNDQSWAGDDGGFVYRPGESKAGNDENGRPKSYASMTYAGLLSFIHANVDKNDPRVQDAVKWIKAHYTLDENPGMGQQGLYYNYHTMAKALKLYGEPVITDSKGVKHNWYEELTKKLVSLQKNDGSWVNSEDRWMEALPILSTSYAVLALSVGYPK
jgi:squalene-hopene/tetraprenyl-beta-curcumene cyclase